MEGEREIARLERLGISGETRGEAGGTGERPLPSLEPTALDPTQSTGCARPSRPTRLRSQDQAASALPVNTRSRRASRKRARSSLNRTANSARSSASRATFTTAARRECRDAEHDRRVEHDRRQQREHHRVRAVAAEVLAQGHLERAEHDRREPREQRRAAVRDPALSAGRRPCRSRRPGSGAPTAAAGATAACGRSPTASAEPRYACARPRRSPRTRLVRAGSRVRASRARRGAAARAAARTALTAV